VEEIFEIRMSLICIFITSDASITRDPAKNYIRVVSMKVMVFW